MNILSKILIVVFVSISLKSISAQEQVNSINTDGIVETRLNYDNIDAVSGTGFFVGPHTLVTAFHNLEVLTKKVLNQLFIIHPETKEQIPVRFIQALDFDNDLAVLHIEDYESPVYYEIFEGSEESLISSEVEVFDLRKESFRKLKGVISSHYLSDVSFNKTLFLSSILQEDEQELSGLSGSPVFSKDGKVIGVVTKSQIAVSYQQLLFSDIRAIKKIVSKPSLNCETNKCIKKAITYASQSKESQYRRAIYERDQAESAEHLVKDERTVGSFVLKHKRLMLNWLKKSANRGFPLAMYQLALIYGEKGNTVHYQRWMKKAAELDDGVAQVTLSVFFLLNGSDIKEGISWAQKAMDKGYFVSVSILYDLFEEKHITEEELSQYIEDFAKRGHPAASVIRAMELFPIEEEGDISDEEERVKEAMNLLTQAAKANHPIALIELSRVYEEGYYDIKVDIEKAKNLNKKKDFKI